MRCWLLVLLVCLGIAPVAPRPAATGGREAATQATRIPLFRPSDRLVAPARGTWRRARWFAHHYGARRPSDVDLYLREVYRLAPLVGLDPAVVVAQSALETDTWRTRYWTQHRNPAGIGITHDGASSFTWADGTAAARGHIVHLYLYAVGKIGPGHVLHPYKPLDPRYDAAVAAGYAGIADTVADLTGRWAVDPRYAEKIAGRGNDIFVRHRLLGMGGSANAGDPRLADDANAATAWQTSGPTPTSAYLWVDLGAVRPIGTIRWLFKERGYADRMRIQVSDDLATWRTVATVGNAPALAWQGVAYETTARYVRFRFANPGGDPKLGALAEVQVWPPTSPALPLG